jgi:uncharacterized repeat protein (TIGR03803 family)
MKSVFNKGRLVLLLVLVSAGLVTGSRGQTFTALGSFNFTNGGYPISSLTEGPDGNRNFYGVTPNGGSLDCYPLGCGALFSVTPEGKVKLLYNFPYSGGDANGSAPLGALVVANNGLFYGTTTEGGSFSDCQIYLGCGDIFEFSDNGGIQTLHDFDGGSEGGLVSAGLIQATDGDLYGTARVGGSKGFGTVFKATLRGKVTTLHSFNRTDGSDPMGSLVQGTDGDFYGTTSSGGTSFAGTVFKITSEGSFTTLYNFCSQANCADGSSPTGGLVLATNGSFYGTTRGTGYLPGTIFEITPAGVVTTLYTFCSLKDCADGSHPKDSLIQASDGNLYGTTFDGGTQNYGTIFKVTLAGTLTTIHRFDLVYGANPYGGLIQASDGNLYGLTFFGGSPGPGVIYRLNIASDPLAKSQD